MSNSYEVVLFIHLLGVTLLYMAVAIETVGLIGAQRATDVRTFRTWIGSAHAVGPLFGISALVIGGSGIYMVTDAWDWGENFWIELSLTLLIVITVFGFAVNSRKIAGAKSLAAETPDGPVPAALAARAFDPVLNIAGRSMSGAGLGIMYVMAAKPGTARQGRSSPSLPSPC